MRLKTVSLESFLFWKKVTRFPFADISLSSTCFALDSQPAEGSSSQSFFQKKSGFVKSAKQGTNGGAQKTQAVEVVEK